MKMWSCPFQEYCGTTDLITIVPTFDGKIRSFSRFDTKRGPENFPISAENEGVCRHKIKFPMDAAPGDKILFQVKFLRHVQIAILVGTEYDMSKVRQYLFTKNVNEKGGFLSFPYPFEAYITLTYDQSGLFNQARAPVWYEYEVSFVRNPEADKIANALMGAKTDEEKQRVI